jgi:hypothetical protein
MPRNHERATARDQIIEVMNRLIVELRKGV